MRRTPLVLVATSLAAFTATLDNTVVAVALRAMQKDLGASVPGLQGVVTAYTVSLAALLLVGGGLVDVLGAKKVLLTGLLVFGAASAGCALAQSTSLLIAVRAVQGIGASLVLPGGLAVLAAAYPAGPQRRRAIGTWAAAGGLALVAGPVLGGGLVQAYGWQSVFWVNVPLCLLVALVVVTTPATPAAGRRLDTAGAVLTCVVLGLATYAVVLAGRHGLSTAVVLTLALALVAAVALALVERRPEPLLPAGVLRDRRFSGGALGAFAASLAVFVLMVFVALYLELVQSLPAGRAGLLLLPLPLALVVVAPLAGRLSVVALPVAAGLLVAGAGLVVLGVVLRQHTSHLLLEVLLAVVGAGVGLTTAPVVSSAVDAAGSARAGLASATVNVARELGGVVAVAGLGALAVSRLTARLSDRLTAAGASARQKPHLLDLLLQADKVGLRRQLLHDIGVDRTLKLGAGLTDTATASFVSSTRVVLVVAGCLLIGLAGVTARLLRN
ncbi:MAG: transporter, family, methylenomycin resistance protein [Frankiales bacterium]|nr:transporter, family, methylenomycin resistance protein [Frankiales bacterium]